MSDVLQSVELVADGADGVPVTAVVRFPAGQAADDGALVRAARAGDGAAFTRLYERYGRVVHGVILTTLRTDEAEDAVQEVFLAAWKRLDDLRDPAAFGG